MSDDQLSPNKAAPFAYVQAKGPETAWPAGQKNIVLRMGWGELMDTLALPAPADMKSSRNTGDGKFNGLRSWEDMLRATSHGYDRARDRVSRVLARAAGAVRALPIPADKLDIGGERPSIPHAVAGDPRSMWRRAPQSRRVRPVVRVVNNVGAPWYVPVEHLENRGAAILAWCHAVESAGYSTEIVNVFRTHDAPATFTAWITLKEAGQKFDLDRLSFALASGDYMRRLMFHVLEQCPESRPNFRFGYGVTQESQPEPEPGVAYFPVFGRGDAWETPEKSAENVRTILARAFPVLSI